MNKYRFLKHTADAKFQAFGETLEQAFANAALATASLMWDWKKIEDNHKQRIRVEGNDLMQLLCTFLEEVVYLLETKSFLLHSVENVKIEKGEKKYLLEAVFKGDFYSEKYEIYGDVKAITYNEMKIKQGRPATIQVVVDM
ncbi:MAG: archease [Candidatus Aminicenantales bacterium]